MLDSITRSARSAAEKLRVKSALNPLLWLTGIGTPVCLGGAWIFRESAAAFAALIAVGLLPVVSTCIGFAYLAVRKPEMLQSEDYQIRHESLQLIQAKAGVIAVDPTSIAAIANPALPALPSPLEEK